MLHPVQPRAVLNDGSPRPRDSGFNQLPTRRRPRRLFEASKRLIDVVGAVSATLALLPLMMVVSVAVLVGLGRPVLFRQWRVGRHGVPFRMLKFRTMRPWSPDDETTGTDLDRLTRLGEFLRATSLDELPNLWNVMRGQMSLVGPRPKQPHEVGRLTAAQSRRHEVRPGITGLAQVSGRNFLDLQQIFDLDGYYVEHRSAVMDLRILLRTVSVVFRREGISPSVTAGPDYGPAEPAVVLAPLSTADACSPDAIGAGGAG